MKKLEEQNRKLVADLDELRGKWGKDTSEIKVGRREINFVIFINKSRFDKGQLYFWNTKVVFSVIDKIYLEKWSISTRIGFFLKEFDIL